MVNVSLFVLKSSEEGVSYKDNMGNGQILLKTNKGIRSC